MENDYFSTPMKGDKRSRLPPATGTRKIIAANVTARMQQRFPNKKDRVRALSDASGVSRSTIQRWLEIDVAGAGIDSLTHLANALHCEPYELLVPDRFLERPDDSERQTEPRETKPGRLHD